MENSLIHVGCGQVRRRIFLRHLKAVFTEKVILKVSSGRRIQKILFDGCMSLLWFANLILSELKINNSITVSLKIKYEHMFKVILIPPNKNVVIALFRLRCSVMTSQ